MTHPGAFGSFFRVLALGLFLVYGGGASVAQQPPQHQPQACAAIADDAERLACYDDIFRAAPAGEIDAVVLESEQPIPAAPVGREPVTMTVACEPGGVRVSLRFAGHPVSQTGDIAPVTFQVDSRGTTVRTLAASPDNTVLAFQTGAESAAFLDSLAGGTNLRVRMTPVRQRAVNVFFRLTEWLPEIAALRARCGA